MSNIYDQQAMFTENKLLGLCFQANFTDIREIYYKSYLNGATKENMVNIHEIFMEKIGKVQVFDMFLITPNMHVDVLVEISDLENGRSPIFKWFDEKRYVMKFPEICWNNIVL